ncbi:MAG: arsenate reductase family protein [Opitutales bacterium]
MDHVKVYTYRQCSTCRRATAWLRAEGIAFEEVPIRETPPSLDELRRMRDELGSLRKLFNTSGRDYRQLGLGARLDAMPEDEALALLATNGNLVKRPFLLTPRGGTVGFGEERWAALCARTEAAE